jgi:ribosomal protein S18 acetylase RimI-like enzyme
MFVNPSSAFVGKPSVVASSSGSAKNARYARLLPSTRNSSASRAGPSSSWSSAPVSVFGLMFQRYRPRAMPDIVEFGDEHLDAAAELLAARHARHREAEPLLPDVEDFRTEILREWRADGAAGVFASDGGRACAYLIARPLRMGGATWMFSGVAGHAVEGDAEVIRDVYAAAGASWYASGHARHATYVPASDAALVDCWFRLSFGASGVLALRETSPEPPYDAGVTIRRGRDDDVEEAARLEKAMSDAMIPAPSFGGVGDQPLDQRIEEWHGTWDDEQFVHFVAERAARVVGHILLYRRPPDLRVPEQSIDLAQASTAPELRGSGIGRALTAHVLTWAHEAGVPVMTTDWRMTNLWASRFWPRRGFREVFLRLYRAIP